MNIGRLKRLIAQLKRELDDASIENEELENTLQTLVRQVEESTSGTAEGQETIQVRDSLWERLKDAAERIEENHPKLTSLLTDLLNALSENRM